mgnify:FL=1
MRALYSGKMGNPNVRLSAKTSTFLGAESDKIEKELAHMDITESDRKAPESGVTEEIWLHYFNDILRVRGVITMREYTKMELKILSRNIAKKVEKTS